MLVPLAFFVIFFGLYPVPLMDTLNISVNNLIENYQLSLNATVINDKQFKHTTSRNFFIIIYLHNFNDWCFHKKSFNLIFNLSSLIIIICIAIILNNPNNQEKIFLDSFSRDAFSNYFKILILTSAFFVLNSSKNFIIENNLDKFEYPIIILLSILGMFFMVSANDLILFYLGLELQSLSLYILASIDRDNLRSSESGIKYFVLSALSSWFAFIRLFIIVWFYRFYKF